MSQPGPTDTTYTRQQWATALLNSLGNQAPSQQTIDFVVNWTMQEDNQPQPGFNLLNTTQPLDGSTGTGTQGNIQVYKTFADGISATTETLKNGRYPALLQELQFNGVADNPEVESEMGTWGTGWHSWFVTQVPSSATLNQQEPGAPEPPIVNNPGGAIVNAEVGLQNISQVLANIGSAWQVLNSPGAWIRVGIFVAALALLIIGVIVLDTAQK